MSVYTTNHGLDDQMVFALAEDKNRDVWVSVWGDGMQKFNGDQMIRYNTQNDLPNNYVISFFEDTDGSFLIGGNGFLGRYFGGSINKIHPVQKKDEILTYIRDIYRDATGKLYLASRVLYSEDVEGIKEVFSLAEGEIYVLHETRDNRLLIGSSSGIYELNRSRNSWEIWEGTSEYVVKDIMEDSEGALWISTHGSGIIRKDETSTFVYDQENGLVTNSVHYVLDDALGHFWIGSDEGLFRVAVNSIDSVYKGLTEHISSFVFTEEDGLPSSELISGPHTAFKAHDGTLWFATAGGIAIFDPQNIQFDHTRPGVFITSFTYQGETIDELEQLELSSGPHNSAEFQFRVNSLRISKRRQYKYRLIGLDNQWTTVNQSQVNYTGLEPGDYRFEVHGSNEDGMWSVEPAILSFTILRPFYQRTWFISLVIISLMMIGWLLAKQNKLKNQLALAKVRIQIADDLHDDFGSRITAISQSLNFLKDRDSLQGSEMSEIGRQAQIAESMSQELNDAVWMVDAKNDTLSNLIDRFEWFLQLICRKGAYSFHAPQSVEERMISPGWRRHVYFIYKEALQNAAKHARASLVEVRVEIESNQILIGITDDGVGFDRSKSKEGRGMKTMLRRSNLVQGRLNIDSKPGHGTRLTFAAEIDWAE